MMDIPVIMNNQRIPFAEIPLLRYDLFAEEIMNHLMGSEDAHCINYFGIPSGHSVRLICCIARDADHSICILSSDVPPDGELPSITAQWPSFQGFEREIYETFGIRYADHPWLKPLRFPGRRADREKTIAGYPFYSIEGEELHEVGVGPIHAGIIEPGHFRFICNGEQILHLEIQLGYQHRGIERLFPMKTGLLQRVTLAENIAGDTVVGHSTAFANVWESLCGFVPSEALQAERAIALEHERMAVHTGDLSAICADIAYQLGSSVFGRLRTPLINYFQSWCGNRFAKSLIRPGMTNFPLTDDLRALWNETIASWEPDFVEMYDELSDLPSALARMERTGTLRKEDAMAIGMVGMAARASGMTRDIRMSHPTGWFRNTVHIPVIKNHGDVFSRTQIRKAEAMQSAGYIRAALDALPYAPRSEQVIGAPVPDSFAVSLVEGWRGEICHTAITGSNGELAHYKIKDPSFHNWLGLSLAVRKNEISDFPVCNKSFNLSYCGHDL
jgi:Ni,Fe-hydrogenase III large subunit